MLGTLAGCGGRLIADALLHGYAEMPGMAELTSPGFVSRSAFMAATTYYLLGYVLHLLPASAAAGLVVTTLVSAELTAAVCASCKLQEQGNLHQQQWSQ